MSVVARGLAVLEVVVVFRVLLNMVGQSSAPIVPSATPTGKATASSCRVSLPMSLVWGVVIVLESDLSFILTE